MYKKAEARERTAAKRNLEQYQRCRIIKLLDNLNFTDHQIIENFEVTHEYLQNLKTDIAAAPKRITRLRHTLSPEQIAGTFFYPCFFKSLTGL